MATTLLSAGITMGSSTLQPSGSAPSYTARAWVNFNGIGAVSIRASGNASSITDNGVGDYTVNFATAMSDANYAGITALGPIGLPSPTTVFTTLSTSSFRFTTQGVSAGSAALGDAGWLNVAFFR